MASQLKATPVIPCVGGLDVSQFVVTTKPGAGVKLINYEPGLNGGYRRVSGFTKYNTNSVPGSGPVLGVRILGSSILAFRGNDLYSATSSSGWSSSIATRAGTIEHVRFEGYNWAGTPAVIITDGVNSAASYNGTTYSSISAGPATPKFAAEFKGHIFYAGYSSNNAEVTFCAPYSINDFNTSAGAGTIIVGDTINGLRSFRDKLYIFGNNSIWALEGDAAFNFTLKPVTKNLGCRFPDTIKELAGDIMFLAPDGVRTISGTQRLDDVELGALTADVHSIVVDIPDYENVTAIVVKPKAQYRLFYNNEVTSEADAKCLMGGIRRSRTEGTAAAWEWFELKGIKPYCTCSVSDQIIIHGGWDGYVYRQDTGNNFNGSNISAQYRTPAIDFGDATERKVLHKVNIYHKVEGDTDITLRLYYDREADGISQPPAYTYSLAGNSTSAVYGTGSYGSAVYGQISVPFERRAVHGSGFLVQLDITSSDTNASYTIEGFSFEFKDLAKR